LANISSHRRNCTVKNVPLSAIEKQPAVMVSSKHETETEKERERERETYRRIPQNFGLRVVITAGLKTETRYVN
jgi:hypothetical protein